MKPSQIIIISGNIFYLFLFFLVTSCTEKIDLKLDTTYTRIVVDGHIATDKGPYFITLTKSADYFYDAPSPTVNNAAVTLSDGKNTFPLTETIPGKSGIYSTDSSFAGIVGNQYTLNIQLTDAINGQKNYSATCALMPVTHLDSTKAVLHADWGKEGVYEIQCFAKEPGDQVNFYMFNVFKNGRLMTDSIRKVVVSNDNLINGGYFHGGVIYFNQSHDNQVIRKGDIITLEMSGITKEYMEFVQQVRQAGIDIPFFSGPPANVISNVSNGGIGFFAAYSNSYASTVVK